MAPETRPTPFAYSILQVVPCIQRNERLNAGVALFCRQLGYLELKAALPAEKLRLIAPEADLDDIAGRLEEITRIVRGDATGGALANMEPSDRFGWLVAPSSTIIQSTPAHTGMTTDPEAELDRLFARLAG